MFGLGRVYFPQIMQNVWVEKGLFSADYADYADYLGCHFKHCHPGLDPGTIFLQALKEQNGFRIKSGTTAPR